MLEKLILPLNDSYQVNINFFLPAERNNLFNEPNYFRLHSDSLNDIYAQLICIANGKVCATMAFYEVEERVFASPKRGTFGCLGLNDSIDIQLIEQFFCALMAHLKKVGARTIHLKCPPMSHDLATSSIVANILLRHRAVLSGHELNYDMQVDGRPLLERIDYGNVKRIRKCVREGFVAEQVDATACLQVYRVIYENRERRGFPMTMSAEQLQKMVTLFPERLHLFAVYPNAEKSDMLAAAVCIALTDSTLYVFYWGDVAGMEPYSPIALLASAIYAFCQRQGFKRLDVGTATLSAEPNHGLVRFKRNLGFTESLKMSFKWEA